MKRMSSGKIPLLKQTLLILLWSGRLLAFFLYVVSGAVYLIADDDDANDDDDDANDDYDYDYDYDDDDDYDYDFDDANVNAALSCTESTN